MRAVLRKPFISGILAVFIKGGGAAALALLLSTSSAASQKVKPKPWSDMSQYERASFATRDGLSIAKAIIPATSDRQSLKMQCEKIVSLRMMTMRIDRELYQSAATDSCIGELRRVLDPYHHYYE